MSEETKDLNVIDAPKKRGNPNWVKHKDDVVKANVTFENRAKNDRWSVWNKDPDKHYVWGSKSRDGEMDDFYGKGYVQAVGNEKIMGNPFEADKDTTGETKERGDRILMCCPQNLVDEREAIRSKRHVGAKEAAQADARKMSRGGAVVESDSTEVTKRESINELKE